MTTDKKATRLLESFLEVGLHLAQDLDIGRILEVIVERAMELTGARYGAAATLAGSGSIDRFVHRGLTEEQVAALPRLPEGKGLLGQVILERHALRVPRLSDHPASTGFPSAHVAMEAFLGVPLQHRGDLVGALYLTKSPEAPPFTEDDEVLVTAMASTAAVAIENSRLLSIETERAERSALLKDIAWKVRHSLDVTEVLTEAVEAVGRAARVDRCYVRLVDEPGTTHLGPVEVEWDEEDVVRLDPSRHTQYPVGLMAARFGNTQWTEDIEKDPKFQTPDMTAPRETMLRYGTKAALATPLEWGDELMGVLAFHSLIPRGWTDSDRALVEAAAREVSVALHHARLYYEALDQAEKLKVLDVLRSDFVSMVSHELRSPMTVVSGIAHILRWRGDRLGPDARDELLDTLERESRRLTRLVSEFLDLEAIERGHIELKREDVDVAELAGEAMVDAGQATRTTIHLDGVDATVVADRDRIKQVLLNLLGNAAKFSEDDSPIEMDISADDARVTVAVRDHGPGIAAEDLERLFERFTRLETTMDRASGSGIGLYVSKHIIDMHSGTIEVDSELGKGATFTVQLPRRP